MMKNIPGYNGNYKINASGVVINKRGHVMRTAVSNSGYLRTALMNNNPKDKNDKNNESIHRLVAKTFIPNPDNLPVVMHKDNDKLNNHVSNLKWGTYEENYAQAEKDGLINHKKEIPSKKYMYKVYNNIESVYCYGRDEVSDLILYSESSLKNMVGNGREITQGPYKGYRIDKMGEIKQAIYFDTSKKDIIRKIKSKNDLL